MRKIALILDVPADKPANLYDEFITALAQRVPSFDLDQELVVLNSAEDRDDALELLESMQIKSEELILWLLPSDGDLYPPFTDYGFTSQSEQHYLYQHLVRIFRFSDSSLPLADAANALLQMQEHLIASYLTSSIPYYVIDDQFTELMERIAKAYRCSVLFIDTP